MTKTASSLTFFLPVPTADLSPNSRVHWNKKSKATKAARAAARKEALRVLDGQPPPMWRKAGYTVRVFKVRESDDDNMIASLKAYRDGLADAGIVDNDRGLKIRGVEHVSTRHMPRIEITVTQETE